MILNTLATDPMVIQILVILWWALRIYFYLLIAYVLMSWVPELRKTAIGQLIGKLADPYMRIFRGLLVFGMMDFTPILGFFLYQMGLNYFGQMINMMAG